MDIEYEINEDYEIFKSAFETSTNNLLLSEDQKDALRIILDNYVNNVENQRKQTESLEALAKYVDNENQRKQTETTEVSTLTNDYELISEIQLLRDDINNQSENFTTNIVGINGFWIGVILIYILVSRIMK